VVDGLIQETGKLAFPPLKPDEFCKILVDIGYLVKHGKGSPWKWIREYKINKEYREYPYQPDNVVASDDGCPHSVWQQLGEPETRAVDGSPYLKWDEDLNCTCK